MKADPRNHRARWGALAVLLLLSACASAPPERSSGSATRNDPSDVDELAASALALWGTNASANGSQALQQIRKAAKAAPERRDIQWLHLRLCSEVPGCEPQPIETELRKLDPANGSVWLGPLARVRQQGDTRAEEQVLEAMSRATNFNVYWTTLIARLGPPLSHMPVANTIAQPVPTPLTNAVNSAVRWLSALSVSAFKPVSAACDQQQVREPERRVRCEKIAQALQRSDTVLAEGLGLGIAQRLAVPESATALQISEKIDTLRYQNQESGAVIAAQVEKEKFTQELLELNRKLGREQDVARAILRWAGKPLAP